MASLPPGVVTNGPPSSGAVLVKATSGTTVGLPAYGIGVIRGAWTAKSLVALTPQIMKPAMGLREALGLSRLSRGVDDQFRV